MKYTKICLKYPDGKYVSIDKDSGGYPYPVGVDKANDFQTKHIAAQYASMFDKDSFKVVELTFNVTE